ncbi:uncharacterized protein LOC129582014 isoform X2 [Paramacrobiotus metropolitanus]|nr:uncharacterized protein LOC129582014 isoform X2 [Paramacrobiotus metropolitanus]
MSAALSFPHTCAGDQRDAAVRKAATLFSYFPDYSEEELKPWRQLIHTYSANWSGMHQGPEMVSLSIIPDEGYNSRLIPDRPYRGHGPVCLNSGSPLVNRTCWYVELDVIASYDIPCAGCQFENDIEERPRYHLRCSLAHVDSHIRVKKFKLSTLDGLWMMEFEGEEMPLVSTGPDMLDSYYTMNTSSFGRSSTLICLPQDAWTTHPIFSGDTALRLDIVVMPALREADILRIIMRDQKIDVQNHTGLRMLMEKYRQLVRDPDSGNFTLLLEDGTVLRCEKKILALCSDYFDAMLKHSSRETNENQAVIRKFSLDVVMEFLIFAYTGECPSMGKYAEEVLELADMYQVKGLKEKAEKSLMKRLSKGNCMKILGLAFTYSCRRLVAPAFIMFKAFGYELSHEEQFWDFNLKYAEELRMLDVFWFDPLFGNIPIKEN